MAGWVRLRQALNGATAAPVAQEGRASVPGDSLPTKGAGCAAGRGQTCRAGHGLGSPPFANGSLQVTLAVRLTPCCPLHPSRRALCAWRERRLRTRAHRASPCCVWPDLECGGLRGPPAATPLPAPGIPAATGWHHGCTRPAYSLGPVLPHPARSPAAAACPQPRLGTLRGPGALGSTALSPQGPLTLLCQVGVAVGG